ncbi:MAG: DoxX family membrane protein [Roseivirga sp.]|nr:DoxX family membrane protein [Roseivirga sp.]
MNKLTVFKYLIIAIRLALGGLFVYAGIQKFVPAEKPAPKAQTELSQTAAKPVLPENVVKIKAYIGGLKQTGFFWPMLGVAELVCGLLLLTQVFSLLGAVMLVPLTINIFLFEVFLGGGDAVEILTHGAYFAGNLLIIIYGYPRLKLAFLTSEKQFKSLTT